MKKYVLSLAVSIVILFLITNAAGQNKVTVVNQGEIHVHADFKVFVNGHEMDFSLPEYNIRNRKIHLHTDNDFGGNVMHIEGENATLGEFFSSLGITFNSTCFMDVCNSEEKTLKFFVNGKQNDEFERYMPQYLDRILISYGDDKDVSGQLDSITRLACVFSGKCRYPEGVRIVTL